MKAIIHIGPPKTGSTALQISLSNSRDKLAAYGFLYPMLFSPSEVIPFDLHQHHKFLTRLFVESSEKVRFFKRMGLANSQEGEEWLQQRVHHLDTQIAQSGAHTCILSGEHFIDNNYDINAFLCFLQERFDDVQVVAYIRPPYEEYPSYLQQRLKAGLAIAKLSLPQDFFGILTTKLRYPRSPDYLKQVLQVFGNRLGYHNVHIVRFSRDLLLGNSIIADFQTRFLSLNKSTSVLFPEITANQSVTAAAAIFISVLSNFSDLQISVNQAIHQDVVQRLLALPVSEVFPKLKIPQTWKALIAQVNFPTYQWIEETFLKETQDVLIDREYLQDPLPAPISQAEFEDWLLGHLAPEGVQQILSEIFQQPLPRAQLTTMLTFPRSWAIFRTCLPETLYETIKIESARESNQEA